MINSILTDSGRGGTFLTWSLQYLSGTEKYYHVKSDSVKIISDNPLTDINAHGFHPNQPTDLDEFNQIFSNLLERDIQDEKLFLYMHTLCQNNQTLLFDHSKTQQAISILRDNGAQIIVLSSRPETRLYDCTLESRTSKKSFVDPLVNLDTGVEQLHDYINKFFNADFDAWKSMGMTEVYNLREFIALNFDHDVSTLIKDDVHKVPNLKYFYLDTQDFWTTFDSGIGHVLDYLGLPVIQKRLDKWINIYQNWKQFHFYRLQFIWYFDEIIHNIINNIDMDLHRFNLDIRQEAAIQRELLYKHNLALKTHGITKFVNTTQLHNLLEPNIYHKL